MSIFHLDGAHKHEENSLRGIRRAKRQGFTEIDLDMMPDLFGNLYACHWPEPIYSDGFRDPKHLMGEHMKLDRMTPEQVARLRAGYVFPYRILRMERMLAECARVGIGARLEPKHSVFMADKPWQHLANVAGDVGCEVRMYALPTLAGPDFGAKCVAAAKRAGIPGGLIR